MNVLHVNAFDVTGGAERVAANLAEAAQRRGVSTQSLVGHKLKADSAAVQIPDNSLRFRWLKFWEEAGGLAFRQGWRGVPRLCSSIRSLGHFTDFLGLEDFHFPATHHLLRFCAEKPDIVHIHNMHGGYFDLRALPQLSKEVPVVITLHDAWLLSGHCAHSFDCDRWKTGCGHCPDLKIYPAVQRDLTAVNWRRKLRVYSRSRLYVATPCRWLMDRVHRSMLNAAIVEQRVIHNGVDLDVFYPRSKDKCRQILGLPEDAAIIMFAANAIRANPFKDFATLERALNTIAAKYQGRLIALAVGENAETTRIGGHELRFVPFEGDASRMSLYYGAADVYVHPAKADTFPNSVIEAMACGRPVVATAVGGIPEQVSSLPGFAEVQGNSDSSPTGILVRPGNAEDLSHAILHLLADQQLSRNLGDQAARKAQISFDVVKQADAYLDWYREILLSWSSQGRGTSL